MASYIVQFPITTVVHVEGSTSNTFAPQMIQITVDADTPADAAAKVNAGLTAAITAQITAE